MILLLRLCLSSATQDEKGKRSSAPVHLRWHPTCTGEGCTQEAVNAVAIRSAFPLVPSRAQTEVILGRGVRDFFVSVVAATIAHSPVIRLDGDLSPRAPAGLARPSWPPREVRPGSVGAAT